MTTSRNHLLIGALGAAAVAGLSLTAFGTGMLMPTVKIGADSSNTSNPFIQPQDPALSGGGRDQTQQFGDVLLGNAQDELLIGRLGTDVLSGWAGNDVIVGGTEHFNPANRDRAFGGKDNDLFLWAPGDGSDFFDGQSGIDAVVFGLMGEIENNTLVFRVSNDQQAGEIHIDPVTGLPLMDVTNSPGFCKVIDESVVPPSALQDLGVDDLVQFFIRGVADSFESGVQNTDNGLRVTLSLKDVEILVCTSRNGGVIEAFDLTQSPPQQIPFSKAVQAIPSLGDIVQ